MAGRRVFEKRPWLALALAKEASRRAILKSPLLEIGLSLKRPTIFSG